MRAVKKKEKCFGEVLEGRVISFKVNFYTAWIYKGSTLLFQNEKKPKHAPKSELPKISFT